LTRISNIQYRMLKRTLDGAGPISTGAFRPQRPATWTRHYFKVTFRCSTENSSETIMLYLVCQQNIGDFRLRTCTLLRRWHKVYTFLKRVKLSNKKGKIFQKFYPLSLIILPYLKRLKKTIKGLFYPP
jgi:hypothetical protein